jgi:multiple sugar transport system substrate-binding protein
MSDAGRDPLAEYDERELIFHPDGRVSRKRFLLAGGAAAAGAAAGPMLFSSIAEAKVSVDAAKLPYTAHTDVKGHLEFWHFWSSPLRRGAIHSAIKQFQSIYKNVHISDLPVPSSDIYNKLDAAVVAQSGVPDVVISDRLALWKDAPRNLYVDLSPYNAKDKVSGSLYFPITWKQANVKVKGKNGLYALPFETDIRVMYINRAALADAGYNPSTVPKTWAQMASMADKLDKKNGSNYSRITAWPFDLGLDELAWLNNGDWVNSKNYPTANSAANVGAGDWARTYVDRYGGQNGYNALRAQITNPNLDLFGSGLQVFHFDQPTYQDFTLVQYGAKFIPSTPKYANIFPYWNVAYLPVSKSSIKPWSFSGGFSVSAPRNKHRTAASTAAAWEFIKFMSLVGQLTFERYAGNIPTVVKLAHDPSLATKQHWSSFLAALKYEHKLTENKYDTQYPADVVPTAQNHITDQSQTPKQALDNAQAQVLAAMKRNGGP